MQLELQEYDWNAHHFCRALDDGRVLVEWEWFREYMPRQEAEQLRDALTAALSSGSTEAAPDCDEFLKTYPFRNAKRRNLKQARQCWDAMTATERVEIMAAVRNYAKHVGKTQELAPDVFRWMGFTFSRARGTVKRIANYNEAAPWKEWVTEDVQRKPTSGPYAVYKPYDDSCEHCKGLGMVSVKMPKRGYTAALRCVCPLGEAKPGRKFDPERDEVA